MKNKSSAKLIDYLPNDEETLQQDISEYKNLLDSINIYDNDDDNNNNNNNNNNNDNYNDDR